MYKMNKIITGYIKLIETRKNRWIKAGFCRAHCPSIILRQFHTDKGVAMLSNDHAERVLWHCYTSFKKHFEPVLYCVTDFA